MNVLNKVNIGLEATRVDLTPGSYTFSYAQNAEVRLSLTQDFTKSVLLSNDETISLNTNVIYLRSNKENTVVKYNNIAVLTKAASTTPAVIESYNISEINNSIQLNAGIYSLSSLYGNDIIEVSLNNSFEPAINISNRTQINLTETTTLFLRVLNDSKTGTLIYDTLSVIVAGSNGTGPVPPLPVGNFAKLDAENTFQFDNYFGAKNRGLNVDKIVNVKANATNGSAVIGAGSFDKNSENRNYIELKSTRTDNSIDWKVGGNTNSLVFLNGNSISFVENTKISKVSPGVKNGDVVVYEQALVKEYNGEQQVKLTGSADKYISFKTSNTEISNIVKSGTNVVSMGVDKAPFIQFTNGSSNSKAVYNGTSLTFNNPIILKGINNATADDEVVNLGQTNALINTAKEEVLNSVVRLKDNQDVNGIKNFINGIKTKTVTLSPSNNAYGVNVQMLNTGLSKKVDETEFTPVKQIANSNKEYIDTIRDNLALLNGDNTFTGTNTFNSAVKVADAVANEDAVNKKQLDKVNDTLNAAINLKEDKTVVAAIKTQVDTNTEDISSLKNTVGSLGSVTTLIGQMDQSGATLEGNTGLIDAYVQEQVSRGPKKGDLVLSNDNFSFIYNGTKWIKTNEDVVNVATTAQAGIIKLGDQNGDLIDRGGNIGAVKGFSELSSKVNTVESTANAADALSKQNQTALNNKANTSDVIVKSYNGRQFIQNGETTKIRLQTDNGVGLNCSKGNNEVEIGIDDSSPYLWFMKDGNGNRLNVEGKNRVRFYETVRLGGLSDATEANDAITKNQFDQLSNTVSSKANDNAVIKKSANNSSQSISGGSNKQLSLMTTNAKVGYAISNSGKYIEMAIDGSTPYIYFDMGSSQTNRLNISREVLSFTSNVRIRGINNPTGNNDVANKQYVDSVGGAKVDKSEFAQYQQQLQAQMQQKADKVQLTADIEQAKTECKGYTDSEVQKAKEGIEQQITDQVNRSVEAKNIPGLVSQAVTDANIPQQVSTQLMQKIKILQEAPTASTLQQGEVAYVIYK